MHLIHPGLVDIFLHQASVVIAAKARFLIFFANFSLQGGSVHFLLKERIEKCQNMQFSQITYLDLSLSTNYILNEFRPNSEILYTLINVLSVQNGWGNLVCVSIPPNKTPVNVKINKKT